MLNLGILPPSLSLPTGISLRALQGGGKVDLPANYLPLVKRMLMLSVNRRSVEPSVNQIPTKHDRKCGPEEIKPGYGVPGRRRPRKLTTFLKNPQAGCASVMILKQKACV